MPRITFIKIFSLISGLGLSILLPSQHLQAQRTVPPVSPSPTIAPMATPEPIISPSPSGVSPTPTSSPSPTIAPMATPEPTLSPSPTGVSPNTSSETPYNQSMRLGYAALQQGDAETATLYFRNALYERPNDRAASIAYWNARNAANQKAEKTIEQAESDYDRYMVAGYDAADLRNYKAALDNFQRALKERPGDYYATQASRNVQTYLTRGQGQPLPTAPLSPNIAYPIESPYNRYIRLGYAAQQRGDYQAALNHFRSALAENPRDRYATIAYWNTADAMGQGATNNTTEQESNYDRYMRLGYDATERGNYQTALINFQRALKERPNDYYAVQAVRNVQTYLVPNSPNPQESKPNP